MSAGRALVLAVLIASSSTADAARPPNAPAPSASSTTPGASDPTGPYAPAVSAPAGTTVLPKTLMREQGDFTLRQGLREDAYGAHAVKLPAGDMILYPATSLHRVNPVTRGVRFASFFWIQSMVREDNHRALLFDLDMAINQVNQAVPNHPSVVALTNCYHNLLRGWSEA